MLGERHGKGWQWDVTWRAPGMSGPGLLAVAATCGEFKGLLQWSYRTTLSLIGAKTAPHSEQLFYLLGCWG